SLGVSVFIKEAVKEFYSPQAHYFPSVFPSTTVDVFGAAVSYQNIGNIVVALLTIGGLHLFLSRTRTGRSMQATAQSPAVAEILGVNVKRMVLYTFLINAALVVVASMLISPIYLAKFSNGETIGIVAFIAAIVGGFNQIRGAFAGGILIGVLDNLTAAYVSAEYRAAVPLVLLIIIILVRPQGLLGKAEGRVV
ncbi:branched-chain amino acid ABC transporter permease, partial [Devosia sp.]|uniref:branched-chain amino acid ABC transporter permease n=1 Tax=Devosia sp. TaxID=1871048 RepID=UPI002EFB6975